MSVTQTQSQAGGAPLRRPLPALTARSLTVGAVLLLGAVLWVRHSELLVHTINLTEATPPVPAIAAILLLAALHPLLRRLGPRLDLTRPEIIFIYFFVAIGSIMPSLGVLRMVIPCATVPLYAWAIVGSFYGQAAENARVSLT